MDFVFQEFNSSFPAWLYLLLIAGTAALAWWSYRDVKVSGAYRYLLISLRTLTFFILLVLLLNPVFRAESTYLQNPEILLLLDDSESISIETGNYGGIETYRSTLDRLNLEENPDISITRMAVGEDTRPISPDELTYGSDRTNLHSAVRAVMQRQNEARAVILLSDGIYTSGQNPVFDAQKINIPLFAVALGDTSSQNDLIVNSVSTSSTGYVDTEHSVSATVTGRGFGGRPFTVELRKGDEVLDTDTVTPENDNITTSVDFELGLEEEGLQQFQIAIPSREGEWTESNNSRYFSVDVLNAKQRILSLAFEAHPDVSYIRSLLLSDNNTSLSSRTWLKGDRFIEGTLDIDPDTVDLTVIHGFPASGLSSDLQEQVSRLIQSTPVVFTTLPLFSSRRLEALAPSALPAAFPDTPAFRRVTLSSAAEPGEHPIMELPAVNYDRLSLQGPVRNVNPVPGSRTLFTGEFRDGNTGIPLLSVLETGNRRNALVTAYGWYIPGQSSDDQVREFSERFWFNIISWTAADPDNRRLNIQPSQNSYSGSEEVIISGYLQNESGNMEADADIDIELSSDTMETRFYSMDNLGGGQYSLDLGTMPEGVYRFEAKATKGDRTIGEQSGEFAVSRSNVEFVNTIRNDQLLRQLAALTNGSFYTYDSLDGFWDELRDRGLLKQQEMSETTLFYPHQHWGWFVIAILFLSAEWILRKYVSLP